MSSPMALLSDSVSQITYFDLETLPHEEFMQELVLAHALLQRAVSGAGNEDELIHFHDMQWWYSTSLVPASPSHTSLGWSALANEKDYLEMLQKLTSYIGPAQITVELTNNLTFVNSKSGLLSESYPAVGHSLEDGNTTAIPIYPCFFRLSKASSSSPSPTSIAGSLCTSSETWTLLEPNTVVSALSQTSDVGCLSLSPLSSSSRTLSHTYPISHDIYAKTYHENHIPSPSLEPHSSSLRPRPPIYVKIRRPSPPLPIRDVNDMTNLAPHLTRLPKHKPDPARSESSTLIRLYLRRASQISRRYSDRFDRHTIGLNGSSRPSRSSLHTDVSRGTMAFLDLAGFAEDDVTVEEGAQGTVGWSLVDIERSISAEHVMGTSVLWNRRL